MSRGDKAIFTLLKRFDPSKMAAWLLLVFLCLGLLSGCAMAGESPRVAPQPTQAPENSTPAKPTATARPTTSAAQPFEATPARTAKSSLTRTPATPSPTQCAQGQCVYPGTLLLDRPIAAPANDQVDASYRFGSTQDKKRDPHHGVEFLNPQGTPVLAAADGIVVVAGDDQQTLYSLYSNYYGNLVVIQHDLPASALSGAPAFPMPVYSLYAHLSKIPGRAGTKSRPGPTDRRGRYDRRRHRQPPAL